MAVPNVTHAVVAMIDADVVPDVVLAASTRGEIVVLRGIGDGSFAAPDPVTVGGNAQTVAATDIDDDGRIDVIFADSQAPGAIVTLRNLTDL